MKLVENIRQALPTKAVAADADHVLDLRKVCKQFGTDPAVDALIDVDLVLRRGEWLSITGPSGSGKSTLLNILGCLDRPTRGQYLFDGIETTTLSENERAGLRSRRVGFIFQSFHLLPTFTAIENVQIPMLESSRSVGERRQRAKELLSLVGLEKRLDHFPSKLSGGERQRVAIARSLANEASVLLADEPTGNLDSENAVNVMDLIVRLQKERNFTLILVTHDMGLAQRAGRVISMKDGHVVSDKLNEVSPPN